MRNNTLSSESQNQVTKEKIKSVCVSDDDEFFGFWLSSTSHNLYTVLADRCRAGRGTQRQYSSKSATTCLENTPLQVEVSLEILHSS